MIPCFNEEEQVHETIKYAMQTQYPDFEVIAINDGSSDKTAKILDELQQVYPRLRVVHLAENQGKAYALRAAAMVSQHEYLVCIDGDALLTSACCAVDDASFNTLSTGGCGNRGT